MNPANQSDTYCFSGFRLDRRAQTLCKNGERISLTPKATQLLLLLLDNSPNLVSRDELRTALWKDSTYIEFEGALNACVRQVRAALGDSASRSRFVETSPKRGYRFVAELEKPRSAKKSSNSWTRVTVAALVVVAIAVTVFFVDGRGSDEPQLLVVLPIEGDTDLSIDPIAAYGTAIIASEYLAKLDPHRLSIINSRSLRELAVFDTDVQFSRTPEYIVSTRIQRDGPDLLLRATLRRSSDGAVVSELEEHLEMTLSTVLRRTPELMVDWIATTLEVGSTARAAAPVGNRNAELDDEVVAAFWHLESGNFEEIDQALAIFNKVIAQDPNHVWAREGKLSALMELSFFEPAYARREDIYDQIDTLARDMLAQDIVSNIPYQALSLVRLFRDWDLAEATNLIEAALLIAPDDARTHGAYAAIQAALGDTAGAVRSAELAERLDPATMAVRSDRCWYLMIDGLYEQAADVCEKVLKLKPDDNVSLIGAAHALYKIGAEQSAIKLMLDAIRRTEPDVIERFGALPSTWQELGCMRADDIMVRGNPGQVSHYQLARYLASCDRADATFEQLRLAIEQREFSVLFLRSETEFDFIRNRPEFKQLESSLP